ncbi:MULTISPECIES: MFS transporter [Bacillaceae]|uniref:MFS transporter n=1 Tax=Bacillaceae TaxID=186817 RepID=UPI001F2065BD|nr:MULTISPECIES: MFS transporter [Bacillaceae]
MMKTFSQLHISLRIRMYLQFVTSITSSAIIPYISVYFSSLIGTTITGVIVIIVILSGIIGALIGGYLSDRIGRRKMMIIAELGVGITYLVIAAFNSPWINLPYISAGLFMINLFLNGMFFPASTAMIHDLVLAEQRKFVFTAMYWLANLATALGTITGAFFFMDYHFYFFFSVGLVSIISSFITYLFIKESLMKRHDIRNAHTSKSTIWSNYQYVWKDQTFMLYLLSCLLIFSLENHLTNYIAIHLRDTMEDTILFGILPVNGINMVGILHAENTIFVVFCVGMVTWMMKKLSDYKQYFIGMCLFVVSYCILTYISSPVWLIIIMLFISIGELMYVPINQSILADLVNENYRSSYLALNGLIGQGQMILAGLAITISSKLSALTMSLGLFSFGIVGLLLMGYVVKKETNSKKQVNITEII